MTAPAQAGVVAGRPARQPDVTQRHATAQYGHVEQQPESEPRATGARAPASRACIHRLRAHTCARPVEAGLAAEFVVTWPPAGGGTLRLQGLLRPDRSAPSVRTPAS